MSELSNLVKLTCSWEVINNRKASECLIISEDDGLADEEPIEEIITVDECVQLYSPLGSTGPNPCKILINVCKPTHVINRFSILCDTKLVEIHAGHQQEYITTIGNELIDDADDMVMFRGEFNFAKEIDQFQLTLIPRSSPLSSSSFYVPSALSSTKNEIWVYGIKVEVKAIKESVNQMNMLCLSGLLRNNCIAGSAKLELGDQLNANRSDDSIAMMTMMTMFKELWDKSKQTVGTDTRRRLLNPIEKITENRVNNDDGNDRGNNCNDTPLLEEEDGRTETVDDIFEREKEAVVVGVNLDEMKQSWRQMLTDGFDSNELRVKEYIDTKFIELEQRLVDKISTRFDCLETKLCELNNIMSKRLND